jgi:hypothetical protein
VELQDVAWSASADAADWQPLEADRAEWTWALNDATPGAEVVPEPRGSGAAVTIDGAAPVLGPGPYRFALRAPGLAPDAGPGPAPAAFSPAFRDVTGVASGDPVEVGQRFGGRSRLFAAAEVRGFPTLDPSRPLVVADLPTLAAAEYAERGELLSPDEWWLEVPDDAATGLAQRLAEPPLELTDVAVRSTAVGDRLADPIALGVIGALGLGSLAAALFAVSGFVVSAAVGARERLTEFALLRALGLSGRELSLWLSLESAFLLLISLVAGVGLGLVLSWVVLPSVTLAPNGAAVVPPVQVAMPWEVLGMLLVLGVAAMVLTVLVIGRVIRRSGVATAMRGQD